MQYKVMLSLLTILLPICVLHCNIEISLDEITRFGFTCNDGASTRNPIIHYPYAYFPDSYGLQTCLWDSTSNTFQSIHHIGWAGMTISLADGDQCLYAQVNHARNEPVPPDSPALLRLDVSNPARPTVTNQLVVGDINQCYVNLSSVGGFLLTTHEINNTLTAMKLLDSVTLDVVFEYPEYCRFAVMHDSLVLTRAYNQNRFHIFTVSDTGLVHFAETELSYDVNQFPNFFHVDETHIAAQLHQSIDIWDCSDITNWSFVSRIVVENISSAVICDGKMIVQRYDADSQIFKLDVFDLSDLANPVILNSERYPQEAAMFLLPYSALNAEGGYVFQQGGSPGFFNLTIDDDGAVSWGARVYEFNTYIAAGRKAGDYLLLPTAYEGLHCIDVSNPYVPVDYCQILDGSCAFPEVNGNLLLVQEFPDHQLDYGFYRLYDISDPSTPELLFSCPLTPDTDVFFNPNESHTFYSVSGSSQQFTKYAVQNDEVTEVWAWDCGQPVTNPVFCNEIVWGVGEFGQANRDIWLFDGFEDDQPALIYTIENAVSETTSIEATTKYIFEKDINPANNTSTFRNALGQISVDYGVRGFGWEDFVGVGHNARASFYDVTEDPTGLIEPVFELHQDCPVEHIERDDEYMYVFTNSNVAIYRYDIVGVDSEIIPVKSNLSVYPNPLNPQTTISFSLVEPTNVHLDLFNIRGQLMESILNETLDAGAHSVHWRPNNCSSGVYLLRLRTNQTSTVKKLLLLK